MPFKSDKQRRYLYAKKPAVAEKFARDSKSKGGAIKKKTHKMPNGKIMKGAKHPT
jgi:hypothetical protein|tara:strand:+ start:106 stop:270 length:165 start_codon:yes stop_codon:yes gene_type:complete